MLSRSKNGFNSSIISLGSRLKMDRLPTSHGCNENAANITANGGQYSAILLQRAIKTSSRLENTAKKNGWCPLLRSLGSKAIKPMTIATHATSEFPRNSQESYGYHSPPTFVLKSEA